MYIHTYIKISISYICVYTHIYIKKDINIYQAISVLCIERVIDISISGCIVYILIFVYMYVYTYLAISGL